jgi:hypothetical protein
MALGAPRNSVEFILEKPLRGVNLPLSSISQLIISDADILDRGDLPRCACIPGEKLSITIFGI